MFRFFRRFCLFLVGFSLPIQAYSLINLPFMRMTPFKAATGLLLVLAAVQFAVTRSRFPRDRKAVWAMTFAVAFGISAVGGFVAGAMPLFIFIESTTAFSLIIYYFLIGYTVTTRDDLVVVLWALVLGGLATALPPVVGVEAGTRLGTTTRFEGLSGQENLFGFDMAVCLPVALVLFLTNRSVVRRLVLIAAATASGAGIALSLSRSAFVSVGAMWGLWLYRFGRRETLQYSLIAASLAVAAVLVLPQAVEDRIDTMVDPQKRAQDSSIQSRFEQWEWAARAFANYPITGVGVGNFNQWAWSQPGGRIVRDASIHSAYFHVLATHGLFGFLPYMALLALSWFDFGRAWRLASSLRRFGDRQLAELGIYSAFLQIALTGTLVGGVFGQGHRSKTMWFLLGLSTVMVALVRERAAVVSRAETARTPEPAERLSWVAASARS